MDWLDQDLPFKESREAAHEDDGGTSYKVSRCSRSIAQRIDIGSSHKGKAPRIISSSSNSDDGDNRGGNNIGGGNEDSEDTNGDNGEGGGIVASGVVDGSDVNQVDHGMIWAKGDENYYATQDTEHGYRHMGTMKTLGKTDYIS